MEMGVSLHCFEQWVCPLFKTFEVFIQIACGRGNESKSKKIKTKFNFDALHSSKC